MFAPLRFGAPYYGDSWIHTCKVKKNKTTRQTMQIKFMY